MTARICGSLTGMPLPQITLGILAEYLADGDDRGPIPQPGQLWERAS